MRALVALMLLTLLCIPDSLSRPTMLGFVAATLLVIVFVYNRELSDSAASLRRSMRREEGYVSLGELANTEYDIAEDAGAKGGDTALYRKPTVANPTGNFLPTDYAETPDALPAPPANNAEASRERAELFEDTVVSIDPERNHVMMAAIKASPTEFARFKNQMARDFLTNPVTTAAPDLEAYVSFVGGENFRTRVLPKDQWTHQPGFMR